MSAEVQARIDAMSPASRAAMWDRYHKLADREWVLYRCCDCDPDIGDADDEDDPAHGETVAAAIVVPKDQGKPDNCPRCGGYLSLDDGTPVVVTTLGATPETQPDQGGASS